MKKLKKLLYGIVALCCSASFSACDLGDVMGDLGLPSNGIFGENTDKDDSIDTSKDSTSDKSEISDDSDTSSVGSDTSSDGSDTSSDGSDTSLDSSDTSSDDSDSSSDSSGENPDTPDIVTDELSIHFLELGNQYTGDCTLIKVGDTEVLIDAGSRKGSAATIVEYVDEYCEDGILEYVIATHAHQDHIAGFVGSKKGNSRSGVFYTYDIDTLIQFSLTNAETVLYSEYCTAVEYLQEKGTNVYTATKCWKGENGASRSYTLGEGITLEILYQRFYEEKTSDENDYSVCTLLTQGDNHYLFTGDLEHEGEASLLEENDLPTCKLYKGGHHGSPTSSTAALLAVIQPEIVCVCCCCGSDEYTDNVANMFPSQAFVDRIAPYTDRVYVTTIVADNSAGFTSMNGNIVVSSNGGDVFVECSNNNVLFKDTQWFKDNREMPTDWLN